MKLLIASIICGIGLGLCYNSYQEQNRIINKIKFQCAMEYINNETEYLQCVERRYRQATTPPIFIKGL